ncbi:TRAP transporter small permease [Marinibaculum pumilum]|uniref:TRAP transporter small permease protein n=1 Tax=Marinibaculum pumilum TaxID=1766165 RepID=A0ABV7L102_9PROT
MASDSISASGRDTPSGLDTPDGGRPDDGHNRLTRWLNPPIRVSLWVAILAGTLMMLNVTVDVLGRTLFNLPLPGTTEFVSAYYMVAAAYLPWAWLALNDDHIKVDLFTRMLSPRGRFLQDLFAKLATILYLAIFTWQAWIMAIQQTEKGEVWEAAGFYVAVWPTRWLLPFAGALMLLYLVLRLVGDALRVRRS